MSRLRYCLLLSTLLYSSVALAQTPTPPPLPNDDAALNAPSVAAAPTTAPSDFMEVLSYVYSHNPQLNSERKNVEIADERVSQAIAGYRPTVGLTGGAGEQREKIGDGEWQHGAATSYGITATQPLFSGFGTLAQRRAADQRVLAARARLLAVEQNILLTTINAWLDLSEREKVFTIAQQNMEHMNAYHDAANTRFKAGDGTKTDIAQSESRLAQAESRLAQAQADQAAARAAFQRVTGLAAPAATLPPLPADLPKTLEEAQKLTENNPELQQTAYQEKATEQDIHSAESALWPQVFLQGSMTQQNSPALGLDRLRDDAITVNVSIPLYQGGSEYSRVREAKLAHTKSHYDALDTDAAIHERTDYAWNSYIAAQSVTAASNRASAASGQALSGVQEEQRQGLRNLTDVLDEQLQLLSTQITQAEAERNVRLEAYRLLAATGQLTAEHLNLNVEHYDPKTHYDDVTPRWVGL